MSKAKFYSMTKPLPFRNLRLFCQEVKERITSVIYNILYRLKIIDKFSITDVLRTEVDHKIAPAHFSSGCVEADVVFKIEGRTFLDEKYYHKKGNRLKRLYTVKDTVCCNLVVTSHLENISLKIGDSYYLVQKGLPVLKITVPEVNTLKPATSELECPNYQTVGLNLRPLQSLRYEEVFPVSEFYQDELKEGVYDGIFSYARSNSVMNFVKHFRDFTLRQLMI